MNLPWILDPGLGCIESYSANRDANLLAESRSGEGQFVEDITRGGWTK